MEGAEAAALASAPFGFSLEEREHCAGLSAGPVLPGQQLFL